MRTYQLICLTISTKPSDVLKKEDGVTIVQIPLTMLNRDCISFLHDWKGGIQVLAKDGSQVPYTDDAARAMGLDPDAIGDGPMDAMGVSQ